MKRHILFLIVITFLFFFENLTARQNFPDYKFRTLTPEGGLSYDGVKGIKQDIYGFIWVLMPDELYRFDGYTYKRYSSQIKKVDAYYTYNMANLIDEDQIGNLFFGSSKGLMKYDRKSDSFKELFSGWISNFKIDGNGNIWVANANGVNILDLKKNTLHLVEQQKQNNSNGKTLFCSDKDEFFMSKDKGHFYQLDYKHMRFKLIFSLLLPLEVVDMKKSGIFLWILTEDQGLIKLNLKTQKIEQKFTFFCQKGNERMPARAILVDKNKNIWIATQQGLYLLNPLNGEYVQYKHSETEKFSIVNNSVWNLNEDRQGNLWIGTYCGGISYVNFNDVSQFRTITVKSSKFSSNIISGFAERGNEIWIGTEGSGMLCYNKQEGTSFSFKHELNRNSLAYDNVKAMLLDNVHKKLWIGMFRGGLDCLDLNTKKFRNYTENDVKKRILVNHVNRLEAESDSGIWVGYRDGQARISYFSTTRNASRHYNFITKENHNFLGTIITDFCRDNENNLWIASQERLHVMNVKTKEIHVVPIDTLHRKDLANMNIQTLYWNRQDQSIWIGTNSSGLIKYDKKLGTFSYFPEISQFNVHSIFSIIADNQNNLWLGTDNGLFKFDPRKKQFFQYDKKDGIQGRIFYPRSCLSSSTGELYFGGTEGFNIVYPQSIKSYQNKPQIIISEFLIDNNSITPETSGSPIKEMISGLSKITLNHNQGNFGFEFSSTNFLVPEKTRFRYRLKGYDNQWIEVDASRRYASYNKVPAGKYIFEIMTTNNDGVWDNSPKILEIHVLPAPWLTWWAFIIYILAFAAILYYVIHYYLKQKELELELYLETTEKKHQEENHQSQLQFFTNISHEFKTPLSLILGTLERIKQEAIPISEKYLTTLGNNAKRLLNLINELMDFRSVENGKMNLKITSGNINEFVILHASDFKEYAFQRKIDFRMILDPALNAPVWFDRQLVEKIIMNLLNNAFRYTTKGSIIIETLIDVSNFESIYPNNYKVNEKEKKTSMFGIVVRDTGIGISEQSIGKIFDRFYMVNDSQGDQHLGSGIGLALVKNLVLLHKGSISIQSKRENGTDILVAFPFSKDEYSDSEFAKVEEKEISYIGKDKYFFEEISRLNSIAAEKPDEYFHRETKRILLVEDNSELRLLISETLSTQYEICEAGNGIIATELLEKKEIDLILSDIMMPGKDGITLCREVKDNISTSHIPFIMLTAKGGLENRIEGIDSGADAYLEKPINFELLFLTIQNLFKQQGRIKEFYAKNFFSDSSELKINQKDNDFMKLLINVIDSKIDQPEMDISYLTTEMSMSRTPLYAKVKTLTGKSIVEFIRHYRMRKAARLLVEENMPIRDVMDRIGIDTQSYFTRVFKQEFGETPTSFVANAKKKQ